MGWILQLWFQPFPFIKVNILFAKCTHLESVLLHMSRIIVRALALAFGDTRCGAPNREHPCESLLFLFSRFGLRVSCTYFSKFRATVDTTGPYAQIIMVLLRHIISFATLLDVSRGIVLLRQDTDVRAEHAREPVAPHDDRLVPRGLGPRW